MRAADDEAAPFVLVCCCCQTATDHAFSCDGVTLGFGLRSELNALRIPRLQGLNGNPRSRSGVIAGMRMGELVGLAWDDVDFYGRAIHVRRTFTHGRWTTPKSGKARTVDMSDQLRAVLLEHRQRFGGRLPVTRLGDGTLVELMFPSEAGGPLCADNFRKRSFRKMIEAADIPQFRFHDIRHTFASLLLAQGESLHYVKEQMGHASIQTTVDVYGHLVPGSNRNAVNRLDDPNEPTLKVVPATAG